MGPARGCIRRRTTGQGDKATRGTSDRRSCPLVSPSPCPLVLLDIPSRPRMFQLVQSIYWIALSAWLGGGVFVAMAAPVIFRTVREADPTLPKVLSVNMEGQHATLLAGTIVGDLLSMV